MNRYSKQTKLPEVGSEGQAILQKSAVLCIGVGGLGSTMLPHLVGAGVGRIGIMDGDSIELSNLHRQVIFREDQIGAKKVLAAKENLHALNSEVRIETFSENLNAGNVENIFKSYDLIFDGTDQFSAKYLINDAAVKMGKTVVFASVTGWEGQIAVFNADSGPCYRCLYPTPARSAIPNCSESGVLGSVVGIVGALQATEGLKWILWKHAKEAGRTSGLRPLVGRVLTLDTRDLSFQSHRIQKNPECLTCADPDRIFLKEEDSAGLVEVLDKALIFDVREREEWKEGHVIKAKHLPLPEILKASREDFKNLNSEQKIIFYCTSGNRSREAVEYFEEMGFSNAFSLEGGLQRWLGKFPEGFFRRGPNE